MKLYCLVFLAIFVSMLFPIIADTEVRQYRIADPDYLGFIDHQCTRPFYFERRYHILADGDGFALDYGGCRVQINDRMYGPYTDLALRLSPDGTKVAFYYRRGKSVGVTVNSKNFGPFNYASAPIFTRDGSKVAFSYQKSTLWDLPYNFYLDHFYLDWLTKSKPSKRGLEYVYADGKAYGGYDSVSNPSFLPDGSGVAFSYREKSTAQDYLRIGSELFGPYTAIDHWNVWAGSSMKNPQFCLVYKKDELWYCRIGPQIYGGYRWVGETMVSPDGSLVAFCYEDDSNRYFRIGPKVFGPFTEILNSEIIFSPTGMDFAFGYRKNSNDYYIQTKDLTLGPFQNIYRVGFTTGGTIFYGFQKGEQYGVVIGNTTYPLDPRTGELAVSPRGNGWCFTYRKNFQAYLLVNGKTYGPFYNIRQNLDTLNDEFVFSPDGSGFGLVYYDRNNKDFVQINNRVFGPFQKAGGIVLGPSAGDYAFKYHLDDQLFLQVGEWKFGPYDLIETPLWLGVGSFAVVCRKGNSTYLIKDGQIYGPFNDAAVEQKNGKLLFLYVKNGYAHVGEWEKHGLIPGDAK